ncbi:hypothetical protein P2318_12825 [Myxococcaceae bacterium GXIMD 01537]
MRRPLSISLLSAALLSGTSACTESPPDPGRFTPLPRPPEAVVPDAGASAVAGSVAAATPGPQERADAPSESIDPARLEQARALVPPPLLYGRFKPEVGTFVEYEVTSKRGRARVLASVVGKTVLASGEPMHQLEFSYPDIEPKALVVVWVVGEQRPMVDRVALSAGVLAPVSVPVDLYLDLPELRGKQTKEAETTVAGGAFAGKARQASYALEPKGSAEVITSDKVPLFGVQQVRQLEDTWEARKTGTGAKPELLTAPLSVPRFADIKVQ